MIALEKGPRPSSHEELLAGLQCLAQAVNERDPIVIDRAASDLFTLLDEWRVQGPLEAAISDLTQALGGWAEALAEAFTQREDM